MGYLQDKHGLTMLQNTPPGTCPECAVAHDPDQPHNQQSLAYQYHFYDRHGKWPTWADAMAHCSAEVRAHWIAALLEYRIETTTPPEAGAEIEIEITTRKEGDPQ